MFKRGGQRWRSAWRAWGGRGDKMGVLRRWVSDPRFIAIWLGAVLAAWVLWAWKPSFGWGLALAALPWAFRVFAGWSRLRLRLLDVFLILFLLTAGVGILVSHDRDGARMVFDAPVGWQKLWGLILAVSLYAVLAAAQDSAAQRGALGLLTGLGAVVAGVFVATHDWYDAPSEWAFITQLGQAIQRLMPSLPRGLLNANVVGGIVAVLLPAGLGLVIAGYGDRAWFQMVWGALAEGVMALALFLTTSRGAWIGVAGGLGAAVAWWLARRWGHSRWRVAIFADRLARSGWRMTIFAGLVLLGVGGAVLVVMGVPTLQAGVLGSLLPTNRLSIYSQAALLVRDYAFTGCGLGNFPLVHSTYALLFHVPVIAHAHSLFLDIAVEQGLPGALASAVVWGGAGWLGVRQLVRTEKLCPVLLAGLLSLIILVVHGLVDDALYGSRGLLLLWMPIGLIVAALGERETGAVEVKRHRWPAFGIAVALALLLVVVFGRPVMAAWYANLGAVAQTRVELSVYEYKHFYNPTLDQIRRQEDLSTAERYFERALNLRSGQATARTRLTHIALARGAYEEALAHAQAAWDADHRDRVTRLLLGDGLVAQGQVEEAVAVVQDLDRAQRRLEGQAYYRYWVGSDWQRAAYAWRAVLMLDPDNAHVRQQAEQAEAKAKQQP